MTASKSHRRLRATRAAAIVSALALTTAFATLGAGDAAASGLFFTDRGVRPMGRGGAFVAGADDASAIWYNPAGLADAGTSVMTDLAWLHFTSEITRRTQVADAAGTLRVYEYPTVNGTSPVLPIPTIAGTFALGERVTLAAGVFAPYAAISTYPLTLDGQPSPTRYSLGSLDGSLLSIVGLWAAFKPIEQIRIGVGVEALVGTFQSTVVFSASPPDRLIGSPEDPQYDALSQLKVGPIFAPSANAGVTLVPEKHVRIGLSGQLPFIVDAPATVNVRLPSAVEFDHARQDGSDAHVRFELPAVVRAGVEVRQDIGDKDCGAATGRRCGIRVEVAYVREFWSSHQSIDIHPDNIKLVDVTGFPSPFSVAPISIPRGFQDAGSYRLGAEASFEAGGYGLDARLGVSYDESAVSTPYLSPLTVDLDKVVVGVGGSLRIGKHWRFDGTYAHVFAQTTEVSPAIAAEPRVNPVQGNPTQTEAINGGTYAAQADILGIGLNYRF